MKICVLPGDGIGPEIIEQTLRVLDAMRGDGVNFEAEFALVGGAAVDATGKPLPEATSRLADEADALLLGASIAWAIYSVLVKKWSFDPWLLTRFVAIASALVYLPVYWLWLPRQLDQVPLSMLVLQGLYQGLGPTIIAMIMFLRAVAILGAERTGALVALVPVLAGLGAVPLLDEPLTLWLVAGLALVALGLGVKVVGVRDAGGARSSRCEVVGAVAGAAPA